MDIEDVSSKVALVINQGVNVAISLAIAVYFYDGWVDVTYGTLTAFAIMNLCDAAMALIARKFKKDDQ